ncbi:MAG: hypothetical protein WC847_01760 [Candidatus Paceibacterota bacterium]|jgi:hypothetical protein
MKNNFQKILLAISAMLLLVCSFAFIFLFNKINDNNQKIEQDTINLQTEARRREDMLSLNRSLQKIVDDRALLESHFIKSSDVVPFLNMIEKLAQDAGVSAQIDSVNSKTNNQELTVELRASGVFETVYKFLILLENSPYEIDFLLTDIHRTSSSVVVGKIPEVSKWEAIFKIQLISYIP